MNSVTRTPIARQRAGKRVPAKTDFLKTVRCYAAIEEAVFSMSSAPNKSRTVLCNPFLSNGTVNTSTIIGVFRSVCAECLQEELIQIPVQSIAVTRE
jgi:hypothetical protein